MKILRSYAWLWVLAGALGVSCSEEVKPVPYDYTKVFTGGTAKAWEFTLIQIKQQGAPDFSLTVQDLEGAPYNFPKCAVDDYYVFHADPQKTFEINEGESKCSSGDPDIFYTDTWSFNNASASLTFVFPLIYGGQLPYIVRRVTDTELELEIFVDQNNTTSYRIYFKSVPLEI